MLPDLESLIQLQRLENAATDARAKIEALPARLDAIEALVAARSREVTNATQRLQVQKVDRQALEKKLAQVQTRLTRFKEQLMEVKTNKEYQAMQSEIARGQEEVQRFEDKILERMLEADELTADVRQAEQHLADERGAAGQERASLEAERAELEKQLARFGRRTTTAGRRGFGRRHVSVRNAGATTEGCGRRASVSGSLHVVPGPVAAAAVQRRSAEPELDSM